MLLLLQFSTVFIRCLLPDTDLGPWNSFINKGIKVSSIFEDVAVLFGKGTTQINIRNNIRNMLKAEKCRVRDIVNDQWKSGQGINGSIKFCSQEMLA